MSCGLDVEPEVGFREGQKQKDNMKTSGVKVMLVGLVAAALTVSAQASLIPILNAGFELPSILAPPSAGSIPYWVPNPIGQASGGVWNIAAGSYGFWNVLAPEGNQVGYVARADQVGPTSITQTLGATVVVGMTYTLDGFVGHPIGFGSTLGTVYTISILANGFAVQTITATGPEGSFAPFSLTWTGNSLYAGETLGILLGTSHAQTAFDALSLTAVPEPTTMVAGALLLLPFGASTLRILRRRTA